MTPPGPPPPPPSSLTAVNPESLGAPRGYSHGMLAPAGGRLLFVAGQIAWDRDGRLVAGDFAGQFGRALENVVAVVRAAGGGPEHLARLTLYVTDRRDYQASLPAVGEAYRRVMGSHYPAMALLEVQGLLEPGAKVEIEATAVLP
ncbi:MAG TPA: RidA family protein [Thermoanaerobaculia bacterium]|nr:RidA family protein [Thermoanaerobaculia bacterium]